MAKVPAPRNKPVVEWITLWLALGCYVAWALSVFVVPLLWLPLAMVLAVLTITLQSSICHELLHGHPFRARWANAALAFPALSLCIPYGRFRDSHIAHHNDPKLTDPYDDPESNYMDPAVWARLPGWLRVVLRFNNTLAGRLTVGPMVGEVFWLKGDLAAIKRGDRVVINAWLWHLPAMVLVIWLVLQSPMPLWAYLVSVYAALAVLKIRTFLEHRAHERYPERTVIVQRQGLLSFLFLNNNLHAVHHAHPKVAWYDLPALYAGDVQGYEGRNGGYLYRSYGEVFRRHLFRAKDPVPHPLWPQDRP